MPEVVTTTKRTAAIVFAVVIALILPLCLAAETDRPEAARLLEAIEVPEVRWDEVALSRAVRALGELSREFVPTGRDVGVNFVVRDPEDRDPEITLQLRGLSLKRIVELVAAQAGAELDIQPDVVVLRVGDEHAERLETEIIPISSHTVRQWERIMEAREQR